MDAFWLWPWGHWFSLLPSIFILAWLGDLAIQRLAREAAERELELREAVEASKEWRTGRGPARTPAAPGVRQHGQVRKSGHK